MAKKHRNEVMVGATVLLVLALTVYIVVALADWGNLLRAKQRITVALPYQVGLKGLTSGSPVYLGGAKVGQVTEAGVKDAQDGQVTVYFTMELPADYVLRQDCLLAAQSNMLGGQALLAIKDLGSQGERIGDGQTVSLTLEGGINEAIDAVKRELDSENPDSLMHYLKYELNRDNEDSVMASLVATGAHLRQTAQKLDEQLTMDPERATLMVKVHQVLDRLESITAQVNNQLDGQSDAAAVAKIHVALDSLNASLEHIEELIGTTKPDLTATAASLRRTSENLEASLPEVLGQIKETFAQAGEAIEAVKPALEDLKVLVASAKNIVLANRESVDRMIGNLTEVSVNFKMASREIRRAPWMLLYKPKKGELQIQGLVDAAGNFAAGAERLDETTLRLRALITGAGQATGQETAVDKERLKAMLADLETTFERFKEAEQKFWKEVE